MGILDFLLGRKKAEPGVGIQAQPIAVNPGPTDTVTRNEQRVMRIRQAIEQGDHRPELYAELERRTRRT